MMYHISVYKSHFASGYEVICLVGVSGSQTQKYKLLSNVSVECFVDLKQ